MTASPDSPPTARRSWRPSLFSVILTLAGIALFVRLGFWQLDRAEQKQALLDSYAAGQHTQLPLTPENADTLSRYQRVEVAGHYDPEHQIVLDNMPSHSGQPGYRVLTPLQSSAGWLLIDRGWIPLGRTRTQLPDLSVSGDERKLTGMLDQLPRAGIQLDSVSIDEQGQWPRVLSFPQQPALEKLLGRKLLPQILLLDAAAPDGFERIWEAHLGFQPERHIGYAVQWFAFAVVAVILFIITGFRKPKGTDERAR